MLWDTMLGWVREPALCLLWRQWGRLECPRNKVGGGFHDVLNRRQPEIARALGFGRSVKQYTLNVVNEHGSSWNRLNGGNLGHSRLAFRGLTVLQVP